MLVGGGLLIGAGLAWGEATRSAEVRANQRVIEEVESHKRVVQRAAELYLAEKADAPAMFEEDLDSPDVSEDAVKVGGELTAETPLADITPSVDYLHEARKYSVDQNVSIAELPLEYITEDEFDEEDGNAKEQILIHMGEDEPLFVNDGVVMLDWQTKISPNILVDMYQMCPPGSEKILYVRNHRNSTDYQVIQEIP
jgi:hypothetical protein